MPFSSSFHSRWTAIQSVSLSPLADRRDPFQPGPGLACKQFDRQGNLRLDLALRIDVVDAVADELGTVTLGSEPEAALPVERDAFDVQLLGRLAATRDAGDARDLGGFPAGIDGEDGRLHAIEAVADGIEDPVFLRIADKTGERAPADGRAVNVVGHDGRVCLLGFSQFVDHHVRAGTAILAEINLVGGGDQVTGRDGDSTFRRDAGRQKLHEFRFAACILVDRHEGGTLQQDEEILLVAELGRFHAFGFYALALGTLVREMADACDFALQGGTGVIEHLAGAVEDREATRTALVVALIGDDQTVCPPATSPNPAHAARHRSCR
jgi:hypothetical protein